MSDFAGPITSPCREALALLLHDPTEPSAELLVEELLVEELLVEELLVEELLVEEIDAQRQCGERSSLVA